MKLLTVTIVIGAYNEEKNIRNLIELLLKQKQENYILEKIVVISDGSTDATVKEVQAIKNKKLELHIHSQRQGLAYRLNQAYQKNTSDILVKIDADTIPLNNAVLEMIIQEFSDPEVGLVGGNRIPSPGETFIESVHNIGDLIWHAAKMDIKGGHNIHNHSGVLQVMRKEVARSITFPKSLYSIDNYIFFSNLKLKKKFRFAGKAIMIYKNPDTLADYFKQHSRFLSAKHQLVEYFGEQIYSEYKVGKMRIIKAIAITFLQSPFLTMSYFIVETLIRGKLKFQKFSGNQFGWDPTRSTKGYLHSK